MRRKYGSVGEISRVSTEGAGEECRVWTPELSRRQLPSVGGT